MKIRTKEQARLMEIQQLFPELTKKEKEYARIHGHFKDMAIESRGTMVCSKCASAWQPKDADKLNKVVCPHCHKELEVEHHKAVLKETGYLVISQQVDDYQAFRFFLVHKRTQAKRIDMRFDEVGTMFVDMNGKQTSFERNRFSMGAYCSDSWSSNPEVMLKKNPYLNKVYADALITKSIHPILKRNGWDGKLFHRDAVDVPTLLLSDPEFETIWKIGQKGICMWCVFGTGSYAWHQTHLESHEIKRVVKLANRHGRIFATRHEWLDEMDYVRDLKELGKDIGNPAILFPANFQEEKMRINDKVMERRERIRQEREVQQKMEAAERERKQKEWIKTYQRRFKDMTIIKDGYVITPLLTKGDFEDEYKALHHCIRTYYGKINALLVSISFENQKTETAEINLEKYEIIQCRGLQNHPSEHHNDIMRLLQNNIKIFKAYNERKFVKKSKKTTNLPAVIYRMAI